jgi:hypothetical protein
MMNSIEEEKHSKVCISRTVLLEIPARLQWENGHGYCGETAIQSFGMYRIIFCNFFSLIIFIKRFNL